MIVLDEKGPVVELSDGCILELDRSDVSGGVLEPSDGIFLHLIPPDGSVLPEPWTGKMVQRVPSDEKHYLVVVM